MADRTPGGREVDELSNGLKRMRLERERRTLEVSLLDAQINIIEMQHAIARREQQIAETITKIEELKAVEQEAANG